MYRSHLAALFAFARTFAQSPDGLLHETPGGGAGAASSGAPAGAAPAAPVSPSSPSSPAAAGAPAGSAASPTGAASTGFSYAEDRSRWVPPHRIVEETRRRESLERELTEARTRTADYERRMRAFAGIEQISPEAAEAQRIRESFFQLFPRYRALENIDLDQLQNVLASGGAAQAAVKHHWDNHAAGVFSEVSNAVADSLGVDNLSERQQARVNAQFKAYVRASYEADPDGFRMRYEAKDPAIVQGFLNEFSEDFVAPLRRSATAGVVVRPRVPSGGPSRPVTAPRPQTTFKSPDEAEDAGVAYMRDRGFIREA